MEHINKFYSHARQELDDFLKSVDYSTISKAKGILAELQDIPEEYHAEIKQVVIDRLKDFYQITMEHLQKYDIADFKILDHLAVQGNADVIKQTYGIARREEAKGNPKPYMVQQNQYTTNTPEKM
ncbi:MAG: hypothetical protein ACMXYG_06025 [Candidatus Woesearchaeota archaeon]